MRQPNGAIVFKILLVGLFTILAGGIVGGLLACAVGLICSTGGGGGGGGAPVTLQPNQCTSTPNSCGQATIGTVTYSCPPGYTAASDPSTCLSTSGGSDQAGATVAATASCNATQPDNTQCPAPSIAANGFTASPTTIGTNGTSTLTWQSSNTTSCTVSGDNGFISGGGGSSGWVSTPALTKTTVFTLTCEDGSGGPTASRSVKVVVDPHYQEI